MLSSEPFIKTFQTLGDTLHADLTSVESYVCKLFGSSENDLNKARVELFKKGKFSEELLPPTKEALMHHLKRSNYQAMIWKRSLINKMNMDGKSLMTE